jgi:hypothetical protein
MLLFFLESVDQAAFLCFWASPSLILDLFIMTFAGQGRESQNSNQEG